jgi:hypothetical protein
MGGMAFVAAALGVAACGGPGPSGLSGPLGSGASRVTSALVARGGSGESTLPLRPPKATESSPVKKSAPSPAWLIASADAAQGWIAATNAFASAAYTDDWNSSALQATETAPALSIAQSTLRSHYEAGIVARGSPKIAGVRVTSMSESVAQVVGCVSASQLEVYLFSGRPVPGKQAASNSLVVSAEVVETTDGWKVQKQSAREGQCSAG